MTIGKLAYDFTPSRDTTIAGITPNSSFEL